MNRPHKAIVDKGVIIGCEYCGTPPPWNASCPANLINVSSTGTALAGKFTFKSHFSPAIKF
jgi:hypothetical protein